MLDILEFYVSSFWVWAGITFGMVIILKSILYLFAIILERDTNEN